MNKLSLKQETRLINYLDSEILILSNQFNNRNNNNLNSNLNSLINYLNSIINLNNLILKIPPFLKSNSILRISYLLFLTNLLPEAFSSYSIPTNLTKEIFTILKLFDKSWILVLRGKPYLDSSSLLNLNFNQQINKKGERDKEITNTDLVRLESIILEIRNNLGSVLGTLNRFDSTIIDRDGIILEPNLNLDSISKQDEEEEGLEEEETPSLVTQSESELDEDEDIEMTTPTSNNLDSSDSDSDFEEVEISLPNLEQESFSIQVERPSLPDVEIFDNLPIRRRGFDPDEEYIDELSDEENLENEEAAEREEERKINEFLEEEVEKVFQSTLIILREFRLTAEEDI